MSGLKVERTVTIKIPVSGPGAGQRDEWTTHVEVKLERRGEPVLRFEKKAGMTGTIARVKLSDLRELVRLLDADDTLHSSTQASQ